MAKASSARKASPKKAAPRKSWRDRIPVARDLIEFAHELWKVEGIVRFNQSNMGDSYEDWREAMISGPSPTTWTEEELREAWTRYLEGWAFEVDDAVGNAKENLLYLAPLLDRERLIGILTTLTQVANQVVSGNWDDKVLDNCRVMLLRHNAELLALVEAPVDWAAYTPDHYQPNELTTIFKTGWDTLKGMLERQEIRNVKLSTKRYRIHKDALPDAQD